MMEDCPVVIGISHQFMKSIHVELANKRQEVVVFEVLREYLRRQARDILHNKRVAFRSPTNDILIV